MLRGPRFRRLYPDVYVPADVPVDLAIRSSAVYLLAEGRGVLGRYSAAEVLAAPCAPRDTPAELIVPTKMRPAHGVLVHRWALDDDEVYSAGGLRLTTPLRTAFDLARRPPLVSDWTSPIHASDSESSTTGSITARSTEQCVTSTGRPS